MSDNKKVKCGVIGVGSLGQHHARIYASLPTVEFIGITDANPERAAEIAQMHDTKVFASPEELAAECEAVSIVVPTFNRSTWLREALGTLIKQRTRALFDHEIVVVDNASTDATRQVVHEVASAAEIPVHYVLQERPGDAATRRRVSTSRRVDSQAPVGPRPQRERWRTPLQGNRGTTPPRAAASRAG